MSFVSHLYSYHSRTLTPLGNYRKECKSIKKKDKKSAFAAIPKPELHDRVHVGINQVTRFMETYIEKKQTNTNPVDKTPVIYICKREIKPLQLCQHLLYMAALAQIKIVPMQAEAESKISQALGIKRACVVLVEVSSFFGLAGMAEIAILTVSY